MGYVIKGETGDWELVIGLEVHCQVISNAKLFSGASTTFGAEPNHNVAFLDAGMPGMLPVINEQCIEHAVRTGLGLKAQINEYSVFARKNYFYADLPLGYQISQFDKPIVGEGTMILDLEDGETKEVGIERLHMEIDAGKSQHDQHPSKSYIDLNRAGVCLMEIVSMPDMTSPEEAGAYVRKLRSIVRYLETCDGNMDEGSMRCDVNVSVRKVGEEGLRTRTETKNVNSVRFVMQTIEAESARQVEVYEEGGEIVQETRLFDSTTGTTRSMRSKEHAHDYRYFPDPDLLPLELPAGYVDEIRKTLPELPDEKKDRFINELGLSPYDASVLVAEKEKADYYEVVAKGRDGKLAANWVITNLFAVLNKQGVSIQESPVSAENLGKLVELISNDTISGRIAKDVFEIMIETGDNPEKIVEEKGLKQITDTGAIEAAIDEIMAANEDKVEQIRGGKDKMLGWFVGQVMKATQGKANPGVVNKLLRDKIMG
ncbi:Aspartyl/glutamyl-tRNA(Asn/Gln) amidotransferase subunit B [Candidatus Terasakiella magnetica]|uniref:Aspartyl/glutamyl-tRNA(Asn/Gln) amidotransferase subunit B n=1 Tax=Candidatus Terasakiella magnetica TaxID=1867952 RepID=A0A1C3RI67_9PROT|nr:Asp-tRNA(Asn)/Glu-tRNA(Gln) amidotransferase subunit GatB [Candidatus Terasakiella magnetica]SCA56967.1 Aspartyl/glutamyl-tRNA(Asn/Gln) amidotransferase subunit B [Candidatus Terasakiella magnetica]